MSEWRTIPAEEFCESVRDGTHDSPKQAKEGRYLVTSRHIIGDQLDLVNAYLISNEDFEAINKRSRVDRWDVLISMIGTVGEVFLVKEDPDFAIKNIGLFKTKSELDGRWLYQFLRSPQCQQEVRERSRGTTQQYIPLGELRSLPVDVPSSIEEQAEIVEILSSLDEKIELNRKQNRTLEAIAQTLFKRWFVEFEFPDENGRPYKSSGGAMQPSELGEIPAGWEVGCIGDFVEHKKDGINPSDQPDEVFFHFSIPNFDDGQAAKPELGGSILSNKYLVAPDSILVSKLNPRFPRIWPVFGIPGERSVCSTEFQVLSPVEGAFGFVLCLLKSPLVASEMVSRASGTSGSHQRINPDDLLSIEVIKPAEDVIERFHLAVLDGIRKVQANLEQNRVLGEVRDTLLPKLMSGELRVGVAA